jgi:hypothetical protein
MLIILPDEPFYEVLGRGHRKKNTERMAASVVAVLEDDDGQPQRPRQPGRKRTRAPRSLEPIASGNRFNPLGCVKVNRCENRCEKPFS